MSSIIGKGITPTTEDVNALLKKRENLIEKREKSRKISDKVKYNKEITKLDQKISSISIGKI